MFQPEEDDIGALFYNLNIGRSSKLKKSSKKKKFGHLRVDPVTGKTTYKNTPASVLSKCLQKGISFSIGKLTQKPNRDVLLKDFQAVETIYFPRETITVPIDEQLQTFTFKTYAPLAFKYFRDLFGISPENCMLSINEPLREVVNPGASGALFFVTNDDAYILKTVQKKEANFLQKLLPGYYMNLVQNPRTLLPKFFGLYCIKSKGKNIRVVVMNNVLPSNLKMHLQFDLKGSTHKRKASPSELTKKNPVFKDLDLLQILPEGVLFESSIYTAFIRTLKRDCLVLESFKIMDYSLLFAIHNIDETEKEATQKESISRTKFETKKPLNTASIILKEPHLERVKKITEDLVTKSSHSSTPKNCKSDLNESITRYNRRNRMIHISLFKTKFSSNLDFWSGGIPATNLKGEKLLVFCGIIDILQHYRFFKRMEHCLKSLVADSASISVQNPSFYGKRFLSFMEEKVFKQDTARNSDHQGLKAFYKHPITTSQHSLNNLASDAGFFNSSSVLSQVEVEKSKQYLDPNIIISGVKRQYRSPSISLEETLAFQDSHPPPFAFDVSANDLISTESSTDFASNGTVAASLQSMNFNKLPKSEKKKREDLHHLDFININDIKFEDEDQQRKN